MDSKIKVHGKGQSRTVLGIVNAYLLLHPKATREELDRAFPETLSSRKGDSLFIDVRDKDKCVNKKGDNTFEKDYFEREDEVIRLADGTVLAMVEAWSKDDFEKAVFHAKQYGIEVAEFEKTEKPGQRGGFWLEGLSGYDVAAATSAYEEAVSGEGAAESDAFAHAFVAPAAKKEEEELTGDDSNASCNCKWVPVLLMGLLFLFFMLKACDNGKDFVCGETEYNQENNEALLCELAMLDSLKNDSIQKAQAIQDSLDALDAAQDSLKDEIIKAEKAEDISAAISENLKKGVSSSFDNIRFNVGSATLSPESNTALDGIYQFLIDNPNARIRVIGHTSPDGPEELNIKLSKDRAKSVVDYLEAKGADPSRLSYRGVGSSRPISDVAEENRRVEIRVKE